MEDKKFVKELEFVQLLCNPEYLKWLFEQGYFEQDSFKNLLIHLQYWKKEEYKIYLTYPFCLNILDQLILPDVCEKLKDDLFYAKILDMQFKNWKNK